MHGGILLRDIHEDSIHLLSSYQVFENLCYDISPCRNPLTQMWLCYSHFYIKRLRLREVKKLLVQGHMTGKCWRQELKPGFDTRAWA